MTELLNDRVEQSKEFVIKIQDMDNKLIQCFIDSQQEIASHFCISPLPPTLQKIVNQIYKSNDVNGVTGSDGKYFFEQMEQINSLFNNRVFNLLKSYGKTMEQMIADMNTIKNQLFIEEWF